MELEAKREKLVEVAAVSAALALQLSSEEKVKAVIPTRRRVGVSPWVLVERQKLAVRGGYLASL